MNDYINDVTFENNISTLVWSPIKNLNAWELVFHTLARSSSLRTQTVGFKLKPKTRTFPIEISANLECPRNLECRESILWMARWQSNELVLVRPPSWNASTTIWCPPLLRVHQENILDQHCFVEQLVFIFPFHHPGLELLIRKQAAGVRALVWNVLRPIFGVLVFWCQYLMFWCQYLVL